jgi:hypothetical protein
MDSMGNSWQYIIPGIVLLSCIIISICSFVLLIPLNTIPAITGVSIIISVAYALSFIAWMIVVGYYSSKPDELVWLNTHLMFLILFPATIAATAMNVTSIQNTRNLLAMQLSS